MKVFAISDFHLSLGGDKPMDLFGAHWDRHWEKLEENCRRLVQEDDLLLLPGDHSWAMRLDDAGLDLGFISSLPGQKVLCKGNHDYWWQSVGKVRRKFPGLHFLQNDAATFGSITVCGSRGWDLPGPEGFSDSHDEKIYRRELERLKLSTRALDQRAATRIAMVHYPPLTRRQPDTEVTEILEQAGIAFCVYGHLHLGGHHNPFEGIRNGVHYRLVSCDFLDFCPVQLPLEG